MMSVLDIFRKKGHSDETQLDINPKDGTPIFKDEIISKIKSELEKRKQEKMPLELQWQLNANFIAGNQYCDINTYTDEIKEMPKQIEWTQREVYNRMGAIYETRLAKLGRIKPAITVRPATNELEDIAKAETSTSILRGTQIRTNFSNLLQTAIAWVELCGTVFFINWWDTNKGRELYRNEIIETDGDNTERKVDVVCEGDLCYGLLTPYEVYPDNLFAQEVEDCNNIIIQQVKTVDEIHNMYGVRLEGRELNTFCLIPKPTAGGFGYEATLTGLSTATRENVEYVTTYMERPNRDYPDGRLIIIIGEDELIYYGNLPYCIGEDNKPSYPLVKCVSIKKAGNFFGGTVYERLIPVQRAYNAVKNRIHDYLNRAGIGSYQVPEGALVDPEELTEEGVPPGKVVLLRRDGKGLDMVPIGALPAPFLHEEERLQREMEYLSGISELAVISATPAGMTSGKALESLKESDDTRLSLCAENIRTAVIELSKQWLKIYKQFTFSARIIKYTGANNIANVVVWCNDDINSFDVVYETENELLDTPNNRRNTVIELLNSGLLTDENGVINQRMKRKIFEMLRLGNWEDAMDMDLLHINKAREENTYLDYGILPQIRDYDNHEIHIDEHNRFRLQTKFELLARKNPQLAETFNLHIKQHQDFIMQRQTQLMQIQKLMKGSVPNGQ